MVLTADKGVPMVVMDKEDYNTKSEELLQSSTYKEPKHISHNQAWEQANIPAEINQGRRWDKWEYIQKAVSNRGNNTKVLWVTKGA